MDAPSPGVRERFPEMYADLKRIAGEMLAKRPRMTIGPGDVVHAAYVKLDAEERRRARHGESVLGAKPSTVLKACGAAACRDVIVEHVRRRMAEKRNRGRAPAELQRVDVPDVGAADSIAVHDALEALAREDHELAEIVELRVFGGMTVPECAEVLAIAPRTVDRRWRFAAAWLRERMQ